MTALMTVPDRDEAVLTENDLEVQQGLIASSPTELPTWQAPVNEPTAYQPRIIRFGSGSHVNMVCASMQLGGAERIVWELAARLGLAGVSVNVFILHDRQPSYSYETLKGVTIHRLGPLEHVQKINAIAMEVLASPV